MTVDVRRYFHWPDSDMPNMSSVSSCSLLLAAGLAGNKPTRNSLHATVITGASRDATATAAAAVQKIHRAQMVMKQPLQNTFTHCSDRNFPRHDIKVIAYRLPRECAKKVCYVEQQQHRHLTGLRQRADAHHISSHTQDHVTHN